MAQGILIISGYNIRAVVAFCRWARSRAIPFHLVARDAADPIFLTDYAADVLLTRHGRQLEVDQFVHWRELLRERHGYQRVLLLPSTEFLNRFMLAQRAALEHAGYLVPLVDEALYCHLSDKYSFGQMCRQAGIAVPAEYESMPSRFPFVAKPRSYAGIGTRQLKPYLVYGTEQLERFQRDEDESDFYYQQYVEGRSLYLLAHIPRQGAPVLFSQENLIQQPDGGSVILARSDRFHLGGDARPYLDLLAGAGFHGLIMIEVRRTAEGACYMIEANPRLWGPMQLVVDNPTGIFDSFLGDYGFPAPPAGTAPRAAPYYFWSGGLADRSAVRYHHFSAEQLVHDYHAIGRHDLFLRDDSMPLYRHELGTP